MYALQKYNAPEIIEIEQEYLNSTQNCFFTKTYFKSIDLVGSFLLIEDTSSFIL